jgi:hypothetical protein
MLSRSIVIALYRGRPEGMSDSTFRLLKKKSRRFIIKDHMLFY